MKPQSKLLSKVAASVAMVVVIAGCSGTTGSGDINAAPSGTVQLSYWGSSTRVEKYNKINSLFELKFPGVKVQASAGDFGSYFDKLNVQAASRSMPCVTTLQTRQLNDYTANGTLLDLQPLIDAGKIDVSGIPKTVLDTGRGPDGKLYMIPFGIAWNAITVNSAMAEQHGIPMLAQGYTWEQYEEWLRVASEKLPAEIKVSDDQGNDEPAFSAYVISNGHTLFKDNQIGFPKSVLVDYWNMWQSYAKAGYTTTPQQDSEEPGQLEQFYVTQNRVLSEQTAGNALPGIQAANPSAKMVTIAFGSGNAGLGNMFFVSGYSIPVSCSNPATAAAYINFWTNDDEAAKVFASDNGAVANERHLEAQVASATGGIKQALEQYQYILGEQVPTQTMPPGYNAVFEQAFVRNYQDVAFGRKSVEEAADAFFDEANARLGK